MKKILIIIGSILCCIVIAASSYYIFNKDTNDKIKNTIVNKGLKNKEEHKIEKDSEKDEDKGSTLEEHKNNEQEKNRTEEKELVQKKEQEEKSEKSVESSRDAIVNGPTIVKGIIIVNKKHPLPATYNPGENQEARVKINELIKQGQNLGLNISNNTSGFRSYTTQEALYNNYVASYGQAQADTFSARPGNSEHQSGLAFDLIDNSGQLLGAGGTSASSVEAANWVAINAHKYGYIVRYKPHIVGITGYNAEPWHLRYVGVAVATDIYNKNISLEEYLGVAGGNY